MMVGVGVDIVDIARFERALIRTPRLRERLFGDAYASGENLNVASLAARFAAKEATLKALGGGIVGFSWQDIHVTRPVGQRPELVLFGGVETRARERAVVSQHLSLSHDGGMAIAFVVMEGAP
jgi:holo-[acyl-carrier protein] synthase